MVIICLVFFSRQVDWITNEFCLKDVELPLFFLKAFVLYIHIFLYLIKDESKQHAIGSHCIGLVRILAIKLKLNRIYLPVFTSVISSA